MKKLSLFIKFFCIFFTIKSSYFLIHPKKGTGNLNVYSCKLNKDRKKNPFQTKEINFFASDSSNYKNFFQIFEKIKRKRGTIFFLIKVPNFSDKDSIFTTENKNIIYEYLILQLCKKSGVKIDLEKNESINESIYDLLLNNDIVINKNFFQTILSNRNSLFRLCLKDFNLKQEIKEKKNTIIFDSLGNFFGKKSDCRYFKNNYFSKNPYSSGFFLCIFNEEDKNIIAQSKFTINDGITHIEIINVNNPFIGNGFGSRIIEEIENFSLNYPKTKKIELEAFSSIKNFYEKLGFKPIGFDSHGLLKMEKYIKTF